jgi:hypothetical protein
MEDTSGRAGWRRERAAVSSKCWLGADHAVLAGGKHVQRFYDCGDEGSQVIQPIGRSPNKKDSNGEAGQILLTLKICGP